jgi:integrase
LLRVTRFTDAGGGPWRTSDVDATELSRLTRHVITASFLAITYLSGIRTGEALNLRRGCISRDPALGLIFMSGQQLKASGTRRERSPQTIPSCGRCPAAGRRQLSAGSMARLLRQ